MNKEVEIQSPYDVIAIKFQRKYRKYGYIYRRELVVSLGHSGQNDAELEMVNCYSLDTGMWIGGVRMAKCLCRKHGLRQIQKRTKSSCVASLGFNAEEQKWYGWSHRAIYGFGIGDEVFDEDGSESRYMYQEFEEKINDRITKNPRKKIIKTLEEAKRSAENFAESVS